MSSLDENDVLTQYGSKYNLVRGRPFKNKPDPEDELQALSISLGRLDPDEVARQVVRRRSGAFPGDGARHTTAGRLRKAGFFPWRNATERTEPDPCVRASRRGRYMDR